MEVLVEDQGARSDLRGLMLGPVTGIARLATVELTTLLVVQAASSVVCPRMNPLVVGLMLTFHG
jgi:aspartate ammonia-lyase